MQQIDLTAESHIEFKTPGGNTITGEIVELHSRYVDEFLADKPSARVSEVTAHIKDLVKQEIGEDLSTTAAWGIYTSLKRAIGVWEKNLFGADGTTPE